MSTPDLSLVIGRALGTVVVTVRGALDAAAMVQLECVLADLIQGQGNFVAEPCALEAFVAAQRERFRDANLTLEPQRQERTNARR